ncbi:DNA-directed RNA polymerase subunit D [archaeon]|jgi:DNA-directed RNA polymerase subunit D|nr:DNA-directed RNA polymerase subunit D [archaeon]MBT6761600.1 DNA-directed RNA polymerase subunit D [archaeon]
MKISSKQQSKDKLKVRFEIEKTSESFVNSIRRMVVEEVPTLAVEDMTVRQNSSALFDEMLALRIGLTPIKTDLSSYSLPTSPEEVEERSARCTLEMELKVGKKGVVYAENATSKDPKCTFVHPKMPLVKLHAKQKVDVSLLAVMGQGKDHTKWAPGHVWFGNKPSLTIKQDAKLLEENKGKYPPQIFDKSGKISQKQIEELNLFDSVDRVCDDLIKVSYADNDFVVDAESWGQLSVGEMLSTAGKMLAEKAAELSAQL